MCLAVPARVRSLEDDSFAQVEMGGNRLRVSTLLLDNLGVGDFVIVHAGFAIQRLDEREAEESLKLLRTMVEKGERGGPADTE